MKTKFIFFCISIIILILSITTICISPMINLVNIDLKDWRSRDCKEYNSNDAIHDEAQKKFLKTKHSLCKKVNAMIGLEYTSFILDIIIGTLCSIFSSLLYFEIIGNNYYKTLGILGIISGFIGFIFTFIYISFSGYTFNNYSNYNVYKTNEDRVYAEYNSTENKYIFLFNEENNIESAYAKFKEYGKKQYNYNKNIWNSYYYSNSEFSYCADNEPIRCQIGRNNYPNYNCDKLYLKPIETITNKYLFEIWLTTLIFGSLIFASDLCLAVFGFLLYKESKGN